MAAWLSKAGHEEMRAAARDVCKRDGACRALASASCLTHMKVFFSRSFLAASRLFLVAATAPDEFRDQHKQSSNALGRNDGHHVGKIQACSKLPSDFRLIACVRIL